MTNEKIIVTNSELTLEFEKFPKGTTLQDVNLFLEWFHSSFLPKQNHKVYLRDCYRHYCNYLQTHHQTNQRKLTLFGFSKLLSLTLLQVEIKQGYQSSPLPPGGRRQRTELKYYLKKHGMKSLFFENFDLVSFLIKFSRE